VIYCEGGGWGLHEKISLDTNAIFTHPVAYIKYLLSLLHPGLTHTPDIAYIFLGYICDDDGLEIRGMGVFVGYPSIKNIRVNWKCSCLKAYNTTN